MVVGLHVLMRLLRVHFVTTIASFLVVVVTTVLLNVLLTVVGVDVLVCHWLLLLLLVVVAVLLLMWRVEGLRLQWLLIGRASRACRARDGTVVCEPHSLCPFRSVLWKK